MEGVEGSISLPVLADLVLRQLFALHAVQELLHAVACLVVATLGSEYHVHTTCRCDSFLHSDPDAI